MLKNCVIQARNVLFRAFFVVVLLSQWFIPLTQVSANDGALENDQEEKIEYLEVVWERLDTALDVIQDKMMDEEIVEQVEDVKVEIDELLQQNKDLIEDATSEDEIEEIINETKKRIVIKTFDSITEHNEIDEFVDVEWWVKEQEEAVEVVIDVIDKGNRKILLLKTKKNFKDWVDYLTNFDDTVTAKHLFNEDWWTFMEVWFFEDGLIAQEILDTVSDWVIPKRLMWFVVVKPTVLTIDEISIEWEDIQKLRGNQLRNTPLYQESLQDIPTVKVWVIDTWVDYNHPDLQGAISTTTPWYDFVNDDDDPLDDHKHWTHVAWTIASQINGQWVFWVNTNVEIVPLKICTSSWYCPSYAIINAIAYASQEWIDVINMSLSWQESTVNNPICQAIDDASQQWVVAVVAAWNHNINTWQTVPWACPKTITVWAVDETQMRASFSNRWNLVDVSAPWTNIYSTVLNNWYGSLNGTSMATPHVSWVVWAIKSVNPSRWYEETLSLLLENTLTANHETDRQIGPVVNFEHVMSVLGVEQNTIAWIGIWEECVDCEPIDCNEWSILLGWVCVTTVTPDADISVASTTPIETEPEPPFSVNHEHIVVQVWEYISVEVSWWTPTYEIERDDINIWFVHWTTQDWVQIASAWEPITAVLWDGIKDPEPLLEDFVDEEIPHGDFPEEVLAAFEDDEYPEQWEINTIFSESVDWIGIASSAAYDFKILWLIPGETNLRIKDADGKEVVIPVTIQPKTIYIYAWWRSQYLAVDSNKDIFRTVSVESFDDTYLYYVRVYTNYLKTYSRRKVWTFDLALKWYNYHESKYQNITYEIFAWVHAEYLTYIEQQEANHLAEKEAIEQAIIDAEEEAMAQAELLREAELLKEQQRLEALHNAPTLYKYRDEVITFSVNPQPEVTIESIEYDDTMFDSVILNDSLWVWELTPVSWLEWLAILTFNVRTDDMGSSEVAHKSLVKIFIWDDGQQNAYNYQHNAVLEWDWIIKVYQELDTLEVWDTTQIVVGWWNGQYTVTTESRGVAITYPFTNNQHATDRYSFDVTGMIPWDHEILVTAEWWESIIITMHVPWIVPLWLSEYEIEMNVWDSVAVTITDGVPAYSIVRWDKTVVWVMTSQHSGVNIASAWEDDIIAVPADDEEAFEIDENYFVLTERWEEPEIVGESVQLHSWEEDTSWINIASNGHTINILWFKEGETSVTITDAEWKEWIISVKVNPTMLHVKPWSRINVWWHWYTCKNAWFEPEDRSYYTYTNCYKWSCYGNVDQNRVGLTSLKIHMAYYYRPSSYRNATLYFDLFIWSDEQFTLYQAWNQNLWPGDISFDKESITLKVWEVTTLDIEWWTPQYIIEKSDEWVAIWLIDKFGTDIGIASDEEEELTFNLWSWEEDIGTATSDDEVIYEVWDVITDWEWNELFTMTEELLQQFELDSGEESWVEVANALVGDLIFMWLQPWTTTVTIKDNEWYTRDIDITVLPADLFEFDSAVKWQPYSARINLDALYRTSFQDRWSCGSWRSTYCSSRRWTYYNTSPQDGNVWWVTHINRGVYFYGVTNWTTEMHVSIYNMHERTYQTMIYTVNVDDFTLEEWNALKIYQEQQRELFSGNASSIGWGSVITDGTGWNETWWNENEESETENWNETDAEKEIVDVVWIKTITLDPWVYTITINDAENVIPITPEPWITISSNECSVNIINSNWSNIWTQSDCNVITWIRTPWTYTLQIDGETVSRVEELVVASFQHEISLWADQDNLFNPRWDFEFSSDNVNIVKREWFSLGKYLRWVSDWTTYVTIKHESYDKIIRLRFEVKVGDGIERINLELDENQLYDLSFDEEYGYIFEDSNWLLTFNNPLEHHYVMTHAWYSNQGNQLAGDSVWSLEITWSMLKRWATASINDLHNKPIVIKIFKLWVLKKIISISLVAPSLVWWATNIEMTWIKIDPTNKPIEDFLGLIIIRNMHIVKSLSLVWAETAQSWIFGKFYDKWSLNAKISLKRYWYIENEWDPVEIYGEEMETADLWNLLLWLMREVGWVYNEGVFYAEEFEYNYYEDYFWEILWRERAILDEAKDMPWYEAWKNVYREYDLNKNNDASLERIMWLIKEEWIIANEESECAEEEETFKVYELCQESNGDEFYLEFPKRCVELYYQWWWEWEEWKMYANSYARLINWVNKNYLSYFVLSNDEFNEIINDPENNFLDWSKQKYDTCFTN